MTDQIDLNKTNQALLNTAEPATSGTNVQSTNPNLNTSANGMKKVTKWDNIEFSDSDQLAGFWLRFCANFIDSFIFGIVSTIPTFIMMLIAVSSTNEDRAADLMTFIYMIGYPLTGALIFSLFEKSKLQASPGKLCCGLIVVNHLGERQEFKEAFLRNFLKYLFFLLGVTIFIFLMAAFTRKKQAAHDMAANSFVIKKRELAKIHEFNRELRTLNGLNTISANQGSNINQQNNIIL